MGILELNSYGLASLSTSCSLKNSHTPRTASCGKFRGSNRLCFSRGKIRAIGTIPEIDQSKTTTSQGPPQVNLAFKLGDIMLDANLELYGPYARPLRICGGGGTYRTCIVEVVQGKGLLGPRTEIERKKLRKHPKNWRLACQTTVGKPDSSGLVIIQQLPEWKAHEWNYGKPPPLEEES